MKFQKDIDISQTFQFLKCDLMIFHHLSDQLAKLACQNLFKPVLSGDLKRFLIILLIFLHLPKQQIDCFPFHPVFHHLKNRPEDLFFQKPLHHFIFVLKIVIKSRPDHSRLLCYHPNGNFIKWAFQHQFFKAFRQLMFRCFSFSFHRRLSPCYPFGLF